MLRGIFAAAAGLALATSASAAELQVFPLRLNFAPQSTTALLTIGNKGNADTLLQIGLFTWSQVDGVDKLDPTRDVLVNPPVFPLKAGAQQIARFGLRVQPTDVERTYRLILQEVPQQAQQAMGLSTLLKMSIPIFVPPAVPAVAMGWRIHPSAKGAQIEMSNSGNVHVQVRTLKLVVNGRTAFSKPVNIYVLPGATRKIPLELDAPIAAGATVQLDADSDQKSFSASVPAE